jgi:hypothetical protein
MIISPNPCLTILNLQWPLIQRHSIYLFFLVLLQCALIHPSTPSFSLLPWSEITTFLLTLMEIPPYETDLVALCLDVGNDPPSPPLSIMHLSGHPLPSHTIGTPSSTPCSEPLSSPSPRTPQWNHHDQSSILPQHTCKSPRKTTHSLHQLNLREIGARRTKP